MAGAGGKEVGRVSIRVVPDLDKFREELRRELEKWDSKDIKVGIDGDLSKLKAKIDSVRDFSVEGKIDADKSAYDRALRDADRDFTVEGVVDLDAKPDKAAKRTKEAFEKLKPEIEPRAKLDRFQERYLSKIQRLISEVEANIPLTADGEKVRATFKNVEKSFTNRVKLLDLSADEDELSRLRIGINRFYNGINRRARKQDLLNVDNADAVKRAMKSIQEFTSIDVDLKVKTEDFNRAVARAKADSEKTWADLDAKLNIKVDDGKITVLRRRLSERIIVPADIKVSYDRNAITRGAVLAVAGVKKVFSSAASSIGDGFSNVGRLLRSFGPENIATAIAIVAAVAALAAPAVALLSGALLTIPAALAAIAVPAGVVALGMDGIKKAAETAKPAFEELKTAISGVFEKDLVPGFEQIRDRLIPGLTLPLQGVAQSLSAAFNGVIDQLASAGTLQNLQRTIDNIGSAIRGATPGLQAFTSGLTNLVAGVSAKFPDLAQSFNNVGKDFDNWVAKITSNGQLGTALDTLKGTLSEIGGTIKDIAQWGFDNLADPNFGAQLKGFASDLRALVGDVLPLLKSGFQDVAQVVSGIRDTIDAIKGASDWFADITGVTKDLDTTKKQTEGFLGLFGKDGVLGDKAPFRQWFGDAPAAAAEAGQKAKTAFGENFKPDENAAKEIVGNIPDAVAKAAQEAKQNLGNLGNTAGQFDAAGAVLQSLKTQISGQMQAVINEAQASLQTLGPTLQTGIDAAVQPLSTIPTKIIEAFSTMGAAIGGAFGGIQGFVTTAVAQLQSTVVNAFNQIPNQLLGSFALLGASIGGAFAGIQGVVVSQAANIASAFRTAFAGAVNTVSNAMSGVGVAVAAGMNQAAAAVATGTSTMLAAFQAGLSALPALVQAVFSPIPAAITAAMAEANGAVAAGGQQIIATMLSFQGAAQSSGLAVGAAFATGLASASNLVSAAAQSLVGAARAFFPNSPAEKGPFSGSGWIDKSGQAIADAFGGGIQDGIGQVVGIAKVLMQQVKDVFGNASGVVFNFNLGGGGAAAPQAALAGVGSQFNSITSSAKTFQSSLSQLAPTFSNTATQAKASLGEVSKQLADLEIQRKQLELAKANPSNDQTAIKYQLDQIAKQKLSLGLQKNQLEYQQKYGGQLDASAQSLSGFSDQVSSLTLSQANQELKQLTQQLAELEIQRKGLELSKAPGADNSAVVQQLEQIRLKKLELGLQKNQLEYAKKYGNLQNDTTNSYSDQLRTLSNMPFDFGKSVGNQFMQDLGMSGSGMIPSLIQQGLDYGSRFVFNVANMDDALQAKGVLDNKMALTTIGR